MCVSSILSESTFCARNWTGTPFLLFVCMHACIHVRQKTRERKRRKDDASLCPCVYHSRWVAEKERGGMDAEKEIEESIHLNEKDSDVKRLHVT